MKRILIIGCSGAGKSTFARRLREITDLPLYHLDLLWHKPDKTHITREEFDARLSEWLAEDEWIIDGDYGRTLEMRLKRCDTVFLLDYPLDVCLQGVEARIGQPRMDMPWVEDRFESEFKQWIMAFPTQKLPRIYALLEQYRDTAEAVIFKTRAESECYLSELEKKNLEKKKWN
ncbi:MAG: adenylate kinase [Clostridia bacterium]|nr:adenylate kinase [Clostridia bacterium]